MCVHDVFDIFSIDDLSMCNAGSGHLVAHSHCNLYNVCGLVRCIFDWTVQSLVKVMTVVCLPVWKVLLCVKRLSNEQLRASSIVKL